MNISYNWIKELIPDLGLSAQELADLLTNHSYETVVVRQLHIDPAIRIVKIVKIESHPNADRLRLATVTDGTEEIRVVCGAPNIEVGQIVPYAPPGTKVLDKEGNYFTLTEAKIRGEVSPGMLNSRRELGISNDHDGIFVLPADTPLGSSLSSHIPSDSILEADITPNRAHDSLSHVGIAKEVAALTGLERKEPATSDIHFKEEGKFTVEIESKEQTPRYMGIALSNIQNTSSPLWLQAKLYSLGLKPINAVVDITNYVLLEVGNPSHAFDAQKLPGKNIGVRVGREEVVTLLDGKDAKVSSKNIVITSADTPVALAGVMGGSSTQVELTTNEIFLEIANFNAYVIQETARTLGLRTEASIRFAKGISSELVEKAAKRLVYLLQEITGAQVNQVIDQYPAPVTEPSITLRPERISAIAGVTIPSQEAYDILVRLSFKVERDISVPEWQVTPPSDRLDITGEHDVVEEVIRVFGLHHIPSEKKLVGDAFKELPVHVVVREKLRDGLVNAGFTETYNYSFEDERSAALLGLDKKDHLELINPIAPEQKYLRVSLLPGLVGNLIKNKGEFQRKFSKGERALFEIGHIYMPGDSGKVPGVVEEEHVAGVMVGSLSLVTQVLQTVLEKLGIGSVDISTLGTITELPKTTKYTEAVTAFEWNLEEVSSKMPEETQEAKTLESIIKEEVEAIQFQELGKYPSVFRDLSILVAPEVATERVQEIIERVGKELVIDVDLFDVYEPDADSLDGEKKKSLAFHIEYQSAEKTLNDNEIAALHNQIVAILKEELDIELR